MSIGPKSHQLTSYMVNIPPIKRAGHWKWKKMIDSHTKNQQTTPDNPTSWQPDDKKPTTDTRQSTGTIGQPTPAKPVRNNCHRRFTWQSKPTPYNQQPTSENTHSILRNKQDQIGIKKPPPPSSLGANSDSLTTPAVFFIGYKLEVDNNKQTTTFLTSYPQTMNNNVGC
jgi:hypothetical protein